MEYIVDESIELPYLSRRAELRGEVGGGSHFCPEILSKQELDKIKELGGIWENEVTNSYDIWIIRFTDDNVVKAMKGLQDLGWISLEAYY